MFRIGRIFVYAHIAGLTLDNAGLKPAGASVGAGVLAALPADRCGLAETARVVRYLALEFPAGEHLLA